MPNDGKNIEASVVEALCVSKIQASMQVSSILYTFSVESPVRGPRVQKYSFRRK